MTHTTPAVTVRFFAAAREAAGCAETTVPAEDIRGLSLALGTRFGPELARILSISTLLVGGQSLRSHSDHSLDGRHPVDVLPPFAGG